VDLRGTVLQTVIADQNGIQVDHMVWSSGLSSSYLNWANPQGIDALDSCPSDRPGGTRLFLITRDFWNKGPKYPITPPPGCIKGSKWNDLDRDGYWDPTEPVIPGWPVSLYIRSCFQWIKVGEATTQTDGVYQFCDLYGSGEYRVAEDELAGWTRSWPANPGYHELYYTEYTTVTGKDFGNFRSGNQG
jgi:SdrD B-like domain